MKKSVQFILTAILISAIIATGASYFETSDYNSGSVPIDFLFEDTGAADSSKNTLDSPPLIALTFDDGPSSKVTTRILDLLEKYDSKATFFVIGRNVTCCDPQVLARAYSMGCEIGNHTFYHKCLTGIPVSAIPEQLKKANDAIYSVISVYPKYLRYPCCRYTKATNNAVNMPIVLWSIDTRDWSYGSKKYGNTAANRQKVIDEVLNKAKDGEIVLMHDVYTITADSCETIIPKLCEMGFKLVTVSELFEAKGVEPENGKIYYRVSQSTK